MGVSETYYSEKEVRKAAVMSNPHRGQSGYMGGGVLEQEIMG